MLGHGPLFERLIVRCDSSLILIRLAVEAGKMQLVQMMS